MTLDGLTLHTVVEELDDKLRKGKIQKVLMPGKEELALQIYSAAEGTMRLVLSADAGECSTYLTEHTKPNPKNAPAFCMFLRKHLTGALISSVEQSGLDRVVTFNLETKDELYRPVRLRLIIEIMGKYSNIILTDEQSRILDSIRRVGADLSRKRQILPGMTYERPPQQKWDPLTTSDVTLSEVLHPLQDTRIDRHITSVLDGISQQTAQEILERAGIESRASADLKESDYERLADTTKAFLENALSHPEPTVQLNAADTPVFFSIVPYQDYPVEGRRQFPTANEMLDFYYSRRSELSRLAQSKASLSKSVRRLLQKTEKRARVYQASMDDAANANKSQKRADLITANLYRLKKGMKEFTAEDFETGETVVVPLDPACTPNETAQKLYKKIAKYKRAAALNASKLEDALEEQDFLLGSMLYIENANSMQEVSQIKETLIDAGYMTRPKKTPKATQSESEEAIPLRFTSPSGLTVFVGRNDRQNEYLTNRTARKDDIWFHAQKTPGSHVLLVTEGKELDDIDDESIVFAAQLAAAHSRAKRSGKTPVDYTQRRNVKKPPKSRPGKVIYDNYYTVYVDANEGAGATPNA